MNSDHENEEGTTCARIYSTYSTKIIIYSLRSGNILPSRTMRTTIFFVVNSTRPNKIIIKNSVINDDSIELKSREPVWHNLLQFKKYKQL